MKVVEREKQDLLSLDKRHQFKIWATFRDVEVMPMQINISCSLLSVCDKLFITVQTYQHIQIIVVAAASKCSL